MGGGIGTFAIQLAAATGARVFTTAGTAGKRQRCVELGAERAIDYREEDFVEVVRAATDGRGADVVLDNMGAKYLARNVDVLADEGRRNDLLGLVADIRSSIEARPEFMVSAMAIDGASESLAMDVREVVPLDFPVSSFDLDIDAMRETIAGLDPVKAVSLRIRPGGILQVDVVERQPVVAWRTREGLSLLDETGAYIGELPAREDRTDLPLIAGEGADKVVPEALAIIAAATPEVHAAALALVNAA